MLPFETSPSAAAPVHTVVPASDLDTALTAQFIVAWAGEGGEEPRLGWWDSQFISFGGLDLLERLLPQTADWAQYQAAREVARRIDAELRRQAHDPDRIVSLLSPGLRRR